MKSMALLTLLACALLSQTVHRPSSPEIDPKAELLETDAAYRDAVLHCDAAKLATIFADDIIIVHSDGGRDTKANFLDAIATGRLRLALYERSDIEVRTYGAVALMFSKATTTFTYRDSPAKASDTSIVTFSKVGDHWKIVAMQNTPRE
jgi:uncharacterized protein (TIGR02246 family)